MMSDYELIPRAGETQWFSGDQKPVRAGVYCRLNSLGFWTYSVWDGHGWLWSKPSIDLAARVQPGEYSLAPALPWCGLTAPPPGGYGRQSVHRRGVPC